MKCRGGCGNTLTDPVSVEREYGPVCYRRTFGAAAPLRPGHPVGPVALFDLPDTPPAEATLTAGERVRAREAAAVRRGYHPLGVALRVNIPLHAEAAPYEDRKGPGLRCGTCAHRVVPLREVAGTYPKCNYTSSGRSWERATGGPGTDVRAYWPACKDHQAKPVSP